MRRNEFKSNIRIVAMKNRKGNKRVLDYYLLDHHGQRTLIDTGDFSPKIYGLCKGGIQVNALLSKKTKNIAVMKFVRHVEGILPGVLGFDSLTSAA